eukprot:SAG31_NODE_1956_length_6817_cov_10.363501_4_plen_70_part_00
MILDQNLSDHESGEASATDREKKIEAACHDIGEFCRLHPRGAKMLTMAHKTLDAKALVFRAMDHPDPGE